MTTVRSRVAVLLVASGLVAAACGDGQSAIDAGNDEAPETTVGAPDDATEPSTETSATSDPDETASTDPSVGVDVGDDDSETDTPADAPAPTTTASPLADLPACNPEALDDADGPIEVTLWFGLAAQLGEVLDELATEYNASQDRVVVSVQNQTDYENTIDNYFNLGVDSRPELLLAPEFVVQAFAESDTFVPVQSCMEASDFDTGTFLPRALTAYSYSGVQWGLPFNMSSPVLFYNKPVFAAAGLDPDDPPVSFDEVRATSQQIVDSGAAAFGLVVDVGRDSAAGRVEQWFGRAGVPYVNNGNGREARATEALFNNETGVEILTYLRDMNVDGLSVNVGENAGGVPAFLKIVDPQSPGAMTVSTSAAIVQVLDAIAGGLGEGLTVDDIGVGFLPGPNDTPSAQVGGASLWIPADKGDVAAAAAWDFAQFLVDAQVQSTWAAGTGYVPVRSDAVELDPIKSLYADDPRFRVSFDQLSAPITDSAQSRPALGPQREVRQVVADMIARVYDDPAGSDLPALLDEAVATANSLIANYNDLN